MSNAASWSEVFGPIESHNKNVVLSETFGHLYPKKNTTYKGCILFSKSGYSNTGNGLIDMDWSGLEDSPALYDTVTEWLYELMKSLDENAVYIVEATMRNYRFWGNPIKLNSIKSWKEFRHGK